MRRSSYTKEKPLGKSKAEKPKPLTPQQIIERFVIRARRVKAHSLVQSGQVENYATLSKTITMGEDGTTTIHDNILADEEALESLAARLRPLIVDKESIYFKKVISAIRNCVSNAALTSDDWDQLDSTEKWFIGRYEKKNTKIYSVQLVNPDGIPQTDHLSDARIAESWAYIDLVHADPKYEKAEALKLSYYDRYSAASTYFCEFTLKVVVLLELVKKLTEKSALQLNPKVWEEPVTFKEDEKTHKERVVSGSVYVFPVGTEPTSDSSIENIPGAIKATPMIMNILTQPEGKATLVTFDAAGIQTSCLRAFRGISGDSFVFTIDDGVRLTVPTQPPSDEQSVAIPFSLEPIGEDDGRYLSIGNSMVAPNSGRLYFLNCDGHKCTLDIQLTRQTDDNTTT